MGETGSARRRMGLVLEPPGVADPFNFQVYRGLRRAVRELGVRGRALTPAPREGYGPSLSQLAREGYDLVVATGNASAPAPLAPVVTGRAPPAQAAAIALLGPRPGVHDDHIPVEVDALDDPAV